MNREPSQPTGACPFQRGNNGSKPARKTQFANDPTPALIEKDDRGIWQVRGFEQTRQLLRAEGTEQAGFRAEQVAQMPGNMRPPILFQEGELHRDQRRKTARFFTPAATDRNYREFMSSYADGLVEELKNKGEADLSDLSMQLAVQVAAQVIGLTDSYFPARMARRIEDFFDQGEYASALERVYFGLRNQWRVAKFFFLDVWPAIRARRQTPREDVISHLIEEGYHGFEILTECITFAAAGMVTTREFISVAAWHMLEDPDLKERYLAADEDERHTILYELLRLEPVVGQLLRRTTRDVTVPLNGTSGQTVTIPKGELIHLNIYDANADESAVGESPLTFCPERERARGVQPYVMSFGDGHHRCPGAYIAIQETDIFLTRLLALEGLEMKQAPTVGRDELVKGYEIRQFWVQLPVGVGK